MEKNSPQTKPSIQILKEVRMLFYISELQCATARHTRTVDNVILGENKLTFQLCSFSVKSVPEFLYKYLIRERNTGREGVTDSLLS